MTYILNKTLQLFTQDYDLVSQTTYVVSVNFMGECWKLHCKVGYDRHILEKFIMAMKSSPEI